MPLYNTITSDDNTKVLIWKVEETETSLKEGIVLSDNCKNRLAHMQSEIHRRGFLSIRHLLKEVGYTAHDLYYDDFGKPHLADGRYISISHSFTFTGIIVSDHKVGIDIEKQRDKIMRIANKYTTFESYKTLANTEAIIRKLTIVWCAKESLYKIYASPGVSFLRHIDIVDFFMEDAQTTGKIYFNGDQTQYHIDFLEFEGFTCAYAKPI